MIFRNVSLILIILSLLTLTLSCDKDKNLQQPTEVTLIKNQLEVRIDSTIQIPLSNTEDYFSHQTHVVQYCDSTLLLRENNLTNGYFIVNWNKKKVSKRYNFSLEGPNGIKRFAGASILPVGIDSVIVGTLSSELYLTYKDSVLNKKALNSGKIPLQIIASNFNLPRKIGDFVYMCEFPYQRIGNKFYNHNVLVSYNLSTKEVKRRNVSFPSKYLDKCYGSYTVDISFSLTKDNKFVFSFPADANLYIYDPVADAISDTISDVRSKYIPDIKPIKKGSVCPHGDENIDVSSYREAAFYTHILYDEHKNVYYRLGLLPIHDAIPPGSTTEISYERFFLKQLVVMILDADFNVIAEKKLPGKTYNYKDVFITEEGLWLSNNNPQNPNFDEDFLSFSLIRLDDNLNTP